MPEQREGGLLQLLGDHPPPKHHQLRLAPPHAHALPHAPPPSVQHTALMQHSQHALAHQHALNPEWSAPSPAASSPLVLSVDPEQLSGPMAAGRVGSVMDHGSLFLQTPGQSPSPQRSLTPDLPLPVVTDASILNLTSLSRGRGVGVHEVSEQVFGNIKRKYSKKDPQRTMGNPYQHETSWGRQPERGAENSSIPEARQKYGQGDAPGHEGREERRKEERERGPARRRGDEDERGMPALSDDGKGKKRRRRRSFDESYSVEDEAEQPHDCDIAEKTQLGPAGPCSKPTKTKDRWSYLKARSPSSLTPPQREHRGPLSSMAEPPSAFPITPSSPLYTNTDSLTVLTPIKRKRGRPKKQPLLTVETIHEGTSTSPPSPLAQDTLAGLNRRRKTHTLATLAQLTSSSAMVNSNGLKLKRGRGQARPVSKFKLGKVQSILNEILSGSSQNGALSLKSSSAPINSAMSVVASTIEARLGTQINVSKRGTIYIGKKRGRKPRAETQGSSHPRATRDMASMPSSLYESLLVPSTSSSPSSSIASLRASHSDATMPSLQPISALPSKPIGRSFLSGGWKLSPPRLLANSPSHLSEVASVKEVTLSPISESHSEETIPSDSGIGTDNNSTSDQTEKGPASRRRYSFDLCGYDAAEAAALEASSRGGRARCERQVAADNFLQQEKKQKHHRRKRKCLQSRDHLHFLSELEEVVAKFQQLRISHRRFNCYPQHPYPSIFRLNFHHYYPLSYNSYPCDSSQYLRRSSADLKAKRRRGRPAKTSEPIASKLPLVQGYGYPLAGGNYYAAPYAMPYAPPLSLGYYPPAPPLYLPHHSLGPTPPSPFMRPAVPPPKVFHSAGHAKLQAAAKLRGSSGPLQASSGDGHFRSHQSGQPLSGFMGGYGSQPQRPELGGDLFARRSREEECSSGTRKRGLAVFGEQGVMSFQNARQELGQMSQCSSPPLTGVPPGKRRYKRREVEQIQKEVRRMSSLSNVLSSQRNFEHVQKILRVKRLQRQAKTGNNVVKRRPGRPRKQPLPEPPVGPTAGHRGHGGVAQGAQGGGRTLGMPVLERCVDLPPGRLGQYGGRDSVAVAIESVVHEARVVPPKRRGRASRRDELWEPSGQ
ncbi:hypothetical protein NHX12_028326 [Muraenolepis orangiensis]|uniref:SET binding protein 1 n=1 Tax=Muraenolepis orangiensis TaxID=630683 RepID=A0A9Q0INN9_9TELE|nr:hypothetical protein NHX12_028326 [Muraenolepis orangiensis]